jgi:type II secretory pathway pseudopilin PulG
MENYLWILQVFLHAVYWKYPYSLSVLNNIRQTANKTFSIIHSQLSISSRPAFTTLELLLVVGILAGLAAFSIPAYRDYQVRSDLVRVTDQVSQALGRAQLRSQAGQQESEWGYSVSHATLFAGTSYTGRNPSHDEFYPMPDTIATSGLDEVSFARVTGAPSATGTIILTSLMGEQREVHILIDRQGIVVNISDRLTVCHCDSNQPKSLKISESAWPDHRDHGDYLGSCRPVNPAMYCTN